MIDVFTCHLRAAVAAATERAEASVLPVTPQGPGDMPAVGMWSRIEELLRPALARTKEGVEDALGKAPCTAPSLDPESRFPAAELCKTHGRTTLEFARQAASQGDDRAAAWIVATARKDRVGGIVKHSPRTSRVNDRLNQPNPSMDSISRSWASRGPDH